MHSVFPLAFSRIHGSMTHEGRPETSRKGMNDWRNEGMNKMAIYVELTLIYKYMMVSIHSIIPSFLNGGFLSALTHAPMKH